MKFFRSFAILLCLFSTHLFSELEAQIDHAPITELHDQTAEEYFERKLKEDGSFELSKIQEYIHFLEEQREIIRRDLYETQILEALVLNVKNYTKAKKKGEKDYSQNKSRIVRGLDEYLIPTMKELYHKVEQGADTDECNGLVDKFTRGFIPYYLPNAYRSRWPMDVDGIYAVQRLILPYQFKKNPKNRLEATNLVVKSDYLEEIQSCLGKGIQIGAYLNNEQIEALIKCEMDISKIDPGISSLWHEVKDPDAIHNVDLYEFPIKEKIYFKNISFRGAGSPKVKVNYIKDGKEKMLKLKLGPEVNCDKAISTFFELAGLNQDQMLYRDQVKVYLGDKTYEEFIARYANKYGVSDIVRYINAHGRDDDGEWILAKDALFEARAKSELRLSPADIGAWDLQNRREYRGLLILWAWVGVNDTKLPNFKFLFREGDEGLEPLIRLHDTGIGLGGPTYFRKPKNILSFTKYYKVNEFPETILKSNKKKDRLTLLWNDFSNRRRHFRQSTWSDLKWMTRQIAKIRPIDIRKTLELSGMPREVVEVYYIKLVSRRNQLVSAFSLEDEYPLIEVPKLKTYNPEGLGIKNGKVVKRFYEGKNTAVQLQENWLTFIPGLVNYNVPVYEWENNKTGLKMNHYLKGLSGIESNLKLETFKGPKAITTLPLGIGVQALLSRVVRPNSHSMLSDGKARLYQVIDRVKIKVAADSPWLTDFINKHSPWVKVEAGIQFFEKENTHIHFEDFVGKAYVKPFKLPEIIKDWKKYAAFKLEPLELIKSRIKYGVGLSGGVGVYTAKTLVNNELSLSGGVQKTTLLHALKDQYGQLHIVQDRNRDNFGAGYLNVGEVDLFQIQLPLINIGYGKSKFKNKQIDYEFTLPEQDREEALELLSQEQRQADYDNLCGLWRGTVPPENIKERYTVKATGRQSNSIFGGLFLLKQERSKAKVTSEVKLPDGGKRYFFHRKLVKSHSLGVENMMIDMGQSDLLVAARQRSHIITEMDRDHPKNFIIMNKVEDFFRVRTHKQVVKLMNGLNQRYSRPEHDQFYELNALPQGLDAEGQRYRKIYSLTRIYIDGKVLANRLLNETPESLDIKLKAHIKEGSKRRDIRRIHKKLKSYLGQANELKISKKVAKYGEKLIKKLAIYKLGIGFLYDLVGHEGIWVMGDVAGIYANFTTLQDLQQLQRRRFAGRSWGSFNRPSPLQKFMRTKRLVPIIGFIEKTKRDQAIYGSLENGVAPNLEFVFNHNSSF
ncbi:MAG: hypothetical protein HRU09_05405 [Oligoflexales bacterium]|nr:hypothetical protein [Oligoflexales bacterium]